LVLVPVPSTARAARQRHGDHLARLARHAARRLRAAGHPAAVRRPVRALPRPDSAGLGGAERLRAAAQGFRVRPGRADALRRARARVVVGDDILTTRATQAAVTAPQAGAGVPVSAAAVLAATRRRGPAGSPRTGDHAGRGPLARG
jgi:predicted amidophosphoribosyltransferase